MARRALWLRDVQLLHSRARRRLIAERDDRVQALAHIRARRAERSPVRPIEGGVAITAAATSPRWALRGPDASGRHDILAAFGPDEHDLEVLGLTVPDAHRRALAAS